MVEFKRQRQISGSDQNKGRFSNQLGEDLSLTHQSLWITYKAAKDTPLADAHFTAVIFLILELSSLCFISWQGRKIQDISQGCYSSTDRGWVYQDPKSKTGTTWKDINEATDPSHCEYHKYSPGRPGCTARKGMSRKTAACSVKSLPATLRNVELLSRLALHHSERVYFANGFWEGWGRQRGTAGWGDMLGEEGVLQHSGCNPPNIGMCEWR